MRARRCVTVRDGAECGGFERCAVVAATSRDGPCGPPGKIGGHVPRKFRGETADWLRARMALAPFTLGGLMAELSEPRLRVDDHSMWNFAPAKGLSFKKICARQGAGPAGCRPQAPEVESPSGRG